MTRFPQRRRCSANPGVIALPHLGASTGEAEDNCAVMVVDQVREYLEHGNMQQRGQLSRTSQMARESPYRIAIANANVPNMLGQISHYDGAAAGLNIHNMLNKSQGRDGVHAGRRRQRRCPRP